MTPTTEPQPRRFFHVVREGRQPLRIEADTVADDRDRLNFKRGGEKVGGVAKRQELVAWWVEDEGSAGPFRCVDLGESVLQCLCDEVGFEMTRLGKPGNRPIRATTFLYEGNVTATIYRPIEAWWLPSSDPA